MSKNLEIESLTRCGKAFDPQNITDSMLLLLSEMSKKMARVMERPWSFQLVISARYEKSEPVVVLGNSQPAARGFWYSTKTEQVTGKEFSAWKFTLEANSTECSPGATQAEEKNRRLAAIAQDQRHHGSQADTVEAIARRTVLIDNPGSVRLDFSSRKARELLDFEGEILVGFDGTCAEFADLTFALCACRQVCLNLSDLYPGVEIDLMAFNEVMKSQKEFKYMLYESDMMDLFELEMRKKGF